MATFFSTGSSIPAPIWHSTASQYTPSPISVAMPDFSSVELPDIATVDIGDVMSEVGAAAGPATAGGLTSALELANQQAEDNVSRLQDAFSKAVDQAGDTYKSLSDAAFAASMEQMDAINPKWRETLDSSYDLTNRATGAVAMYMMANLPTMMQQGADIAEAQGKLTKDLMAGKIPSDVEDMIKTRAAETAQRFGIFGNNAGGAGRAMEARDLGMQSLQLQEMGAGMARDNAALWSAPALQASAMATAAQQPVTALLAQQQSLLPKVDINGVFQAAYDSYVKPATVNPDTVFQSALATYNNAMGWGLDVHNSNMEAQAQYDSMALQFESDKMNANVAAYNADLAANTTLQGAAMAANATTNAATTAANASMYNAYTQAAAAIEAANISTVSVGSGKGGAIRHRITGDKNLDRLASHADVWR